ncbi:DsbA family protein [Pontibacter sp. KCTC 32443]|uniref:DsbA family protein n=1 Tax=Pontibacter TaxID=323449 RepID=UPI00164ECC9E|nr:MULTISPECIES: DsbA family protein [Pontibacter]MBC5773442.1 DsbA family protein [Pontibacter sp. KCTC 32443]
MEKYDLLDVPHLIYVMDPMCSWCYGFAPVLHRIKEEQEGKLNFKLVLGGLRANTAPMEAEDVQKTRQHWQDVEQVTAQPFDYSFFEREDFIYNTEPACRAVITMRYLKPEAELEMAEKIQSAFYAGNNDVTNEVVLAEIATTFGIEEEAFLEKFNTEDMKEKTQQDFVIARHLQAVAFPSVYLLNGNEVNVLSRGYRTYEAMSKLIENAMKLINNPNQ